MAVSCVAELEQGGTAAGDSLEGAPVTITFSVPDIPLLSATKTLESGDGDITGTPYLDPDKLYLVVCGGSLSIKYIRKATYLDAIPNYTVPEDQYPSSEGDRKVTLYRFRVQLELSDFPRTIHILGNVDENQLITGSYSYNSLPNILSYPDKQAYWQELHVPKIKAETDPITKKPIKNNDGSYTPDDETLGYFQHIPLIRNFAKIQVTNATENFHLHSYAVIFFPERGSVVPYRSNEPIKENRFDFNPPEKYLFSGYEKSTFTQLESSINYLGNMPSNVALSTVIPPASEFENPITSGGRVLKYDPDDTESGFYVYERGVPTDKIGPTFIIVCGKFETDDNWYYYRLDLMESKDEGDQTVSKYYPIYRNFRYNIQLHRISSEGVLTPEAAANSSGAEDISADVSMRHLSDISNGTTRLVVEPFMTRTYSGPAKEGEYYELYARFFNDVTSDEPNMNTVAVRVELEPMTDGSDDILILYDDNGTRVPKKGHFFPKAAEDVGGVRGIRTIRFNTVEPLSETKTQKIKITGYNPGTNQELRLYREVEITLQKKQPLTVTCTDPVSTSTGSSVTVGIAIPSELPESMFPVEFIVEPEAGTLTPDTSKDVNMPVVSGKSIATTTSAFLDSPTFYYIRTLTWNEFLGLPVSEGRRTFNCYFKTNRVLNATTVWVYNEYFDKDSYTFKNILPLTLTCTDPVLETVGSPLELKLTTYSDLPESMFPLIFYIKPDDMTFEIAGTDQGTDEDQDNQRFIRTLGWNEYSNLPVTGEMRTFVCEFTTTEEESATTITVSNENFETADVTFQNVKKLPKNHFWVLAEEDCVVKLKKSGLQYLKDDMKDWADYTSNSEITLTKGHKVSFKGGKASSPVSWTDGDKGAFTSKGGSLIVGGDITSLVVGNDYPEAGADVKDVRFVDFFKNNKQIRDAYQLILPMTKLSASAFKSMFDGCANLEQAPQYLPATTLGATCYRNMFNECKKLTVVPVLPLATLASGAYQKMFTGCSILSSIKFRGTTWNTDAFYSVDTRYNPKKNPYRDDLPDYAAYWCDGVAAEGEIWLDQSLRNVANWDTTWGTIIPLGTWTIKYYGIDDVEQP